MKIGKILPATVLAGSLLVSTSADAATIILQNLTAKWQNTVGGAAVSASPQANVATLSWGTGGPQSGYVFDAVNTPPGLTFVIPPSPTPSQKLGTFTHNNNPINSGTAITQTQLVINTQVIIDGNNQGFFNFTFDIFHDETSNSGPGPNCCDDIVTFSTNNLTQVFNVGGTNYTLKLTGFGDTANSLVTQFNSPEGGSNDVGLWGLVTAFTPVPEPSSWLMMIGGFALVGHAVRRRKTAVSFA